MLEDIMFHVFTTKKEKITLFLTDLFSLSYFMFIVLCHFNSVNSLEYIGRIA